MQMPKLKGGGNRANALLAIDREMTRPIPGDKIRPQHGGRGRPQPGVDYTPKKNIPNYLIQPGGGTSRDLPGVPDIYGTMLRSLQPQPLDTYFGQPAGPSPAAPIGPRPPASASPARGFSG